MSHFGFLFYLKSQKLGFPFLFQYFSSLLYMLLNMHSFRSLIAAFLPDKFINLSIDSTTIKLLTTRTWEFITSPGSNINCFLPQFYSVSPLRLFRISLWYPSRPRLLHPFHTYELFSIGFTAIGLHVISPKTRLSSTVYEIFFIVFASSLPYSADSLGYFSFSISPQRTVFLWYLFNLLNWLNCVRLFGRQKKVLASPNNLSLICFRVLFSKHSYKIWRFLELFKVPTNIFTI